MKKILDRLRFLINYNVGIVKNRRGNHRGAVKNYERAIKVNPNDAEVFYCCGIANFDLKNREEAIKCYDKAIKLNSYHPRAYLYRGLAKYMLKDIEGARNDLTKAGELGLTRAYDFIKNHF